MKCQKAEKKKKNLRILAHEIPTSHPTLRLRITAHQFNKIRAPDAQINGARNAQIIGARNAQK